MTFLKTHRNTILLITALVVGTILILYPTVSDYWNSFHQSRAIMSYSEQVSNIHQDEYQAIIASARAYNRELAADGVKWIMEDGDVEAYNQELNFTGGGIMGYIVINKIDVMLPIYHGTEENVLQTSIGHLTGTSLPVGAASWDLAEKSVTDPKDGSHCVLSGHRGLPSAKLFTNLDKLVEGDTFTINVLDETLTYQVDQIRVVEPTDSSELQIVPGMDYCTLVTCTPYGINTQRLLVRGHRVANAQGDVKVVTDALIIDRVYIIPFLAVPVLVLLIVIMLHVTGRRKKYKTSLTTFAADYTSEERLAAVRKQLNETYSKRNTNIQEMM